MPYHARKVRRICDVKGCRNTDCYSISKSRETGNSIIICKECLAGGLDAIGEAEKNSAVPKTAGSSKPPELFFLGSAGNPKTKEKAEDAKKADEEIPKTEKSETKDSPAKSSTSKKNSKVSKVEARS